MWIILLVLLKYFPGTNFVSMLVSYGNIVEKYFVSKTFGMYACMFSNSTGLRKHELFSG